MYARKIAAAAGFACGAAMALAPLAAADVTGIDPSAVLGSEVSSLNGLFQFDALLSGVPSSDYAPSGVGGLDTLLLADVAKDAPQSGTPSTLDYLLYGVKPFDAGVSSDSGAFSEFNGALTQFDNAYNVELYSLANGGTLDTNLSDYLYNGTIQTVLATPGETTTQAFDTLYNHAIGDLSGFFQTNLSFLDMTPPATTDAAAGAATDFSGVLSSEIGAENSMFQFDALLAGVPSTDYSNVGGFDTINAADISSVVGNGTTPFDYLIFGVDPTAAGIASDPGSFNVLNGAETKFDDAYNVLLYAAENHGALIPDADLFGNHITDALAGGTAASAFEYFYNFAIGDLGGFFNTDLGAFDITAAQATSLFDLFEPTVSTLSSLF